MINDSMRPEGPDSQEIADRISVKGYDRTRHEKDEHHRNRVSDNPIVGGCNGVHGRCRQHIIAGIKLAGCPIPRFFLARVGTNTPLFAIRGVDVFRLA